MTVLITGASSGIGKAIAELFCQEGHSVYGLDIKDSTLTGYASYFHYKVDISIDELPDIPNDIHIIINNAGVQNTDKDIDINLKGTIRVTEKYGIDNPYICSIVNIASASAHTGSEFPEYAASKGGMLSYTKNVAMRIAQYSATCNSISPGGVLTELNSNVIKDADKWQKIMNLTPLKKWATCQEIADWVYFLAVNNTSMTGQDILIDNGESSNFTFVW